MMSGSIRKRANASNPARAGMPATAPYGKIGEDDDYLSVTAIVWGFCGCLAFLALIATIVLASILTHRVVPPKALSDTCNDNNPCTLDFLETVRGVDSGCCSHCDLPNAATCESACYDNPQCTSGECTGTCKGHCEDSNALDCPQIHAANLTALFDLGGVGNDAYTDIFTLYRECALSACIYTIDVLVSNVTYARDAFVVSRRREFPGNDTNMSATNATGHLDTYAAGDDFHSDIICLPLIAAADRECMRVISMELDLGTSPVLDMRCKYAYSCTSAPSTAGSIEFPARVY